MDSSTFEYAVRLPNSIFNDNRQRFLKKFKEQVPEVDKAIFMFKGKEEISIDSTDVEYAVRQESYFYYLFGVQETGCSAAIDISTEELWMKVLSTDELKEMYPDFKIHFVDELEQWTKDFNPSTIYVNLGINSDSGLSTLIPTFKWLEEYKVDNVATHTILSECRSIKSPQEIEMCEIATRISSEAHVHTMRHCKPGIRESYLDSKFKSYCYEKYNCKHIHYYSICACGPNPSTLHYIVNNDILPEKSMCLIDMGHALHGYGADITCCYPTDGVFTEKQAQIYNLVLKANRTVMANMKPGVKWPDMHILAERVILQGLKELGIVKDKDLDEMIEKRVGFAFMPHGLGHLLGLDVHEVGGYCGHHPARSDKWGLKNLRTSRELEENMVITVEPGCYFIKSLLESKEVDIGVNIDEYINVELAMEYAKEVAGVRIEDDVVVTADGIRNMTSVPRTVEQIEACMRGEDWTTLPDYVLS